ncbi:MAG TPA: hypothetical protein VN643_04835 [Pyrinomonadaceae bacterium]|nr:hypothetical protein [Pyrinomonadaceae bacterium]
MVAEQNQSSQRLIQGFDSQFFEIHTRAHNMVGLTPPNLLYSGVLKSQTVRLPSIGELLLRSAAAVERTFGGITANLWDDPFEWTLPEYLSTNERVNEYLEEVEATRQRAFARFESDADLLKEVLIPAGTTCPLILLLTDTLVKAIDYQGRAMATLNFALSGQETELQL